MDASASRPRIGPLGRPLRAAFGLYGAVLLACGLAGVLAVVGLARAADRLDQTAWAVVAALGLLTLLGLAAATVAARRATATVAAGLHELDQAKSEFVSSVSHELRTPLTSIVGYLELLADGDYGELAAPQREALEVVRRNSSRLLGLIEDLLTLSRIESGAFVVELRPVEVSLLVGGVRRAVAAPLGARRLELVGSTPDEPLTVLGDAVQLERALRHLVGNAVKFSPDGGRVELAARRVGGHAELLVADHGAGIPLAEQQGVFSHFFRASTARRGAVQGTGLGLAVVKHIVDRHGGAIVVESAPGAGTTVRVTLPLAPAALAPGDCTASPDPAASG
jgi:two-component system, OmpR family, phosphate regulon sensor histidine kinase PhoR